MDSEGIPWWTYFDSKTRKVVYAESGSENNGSTVVKFEIKSWIPRYSFTSQEFPTCITNNIDFQN